MTGAFAVAGMAQVYLERRMGMDFLAVQKEIEVHFFGLVLAAALFTLGIVLSSQLHRLRFAGIPLRWREVEAGRPLPVRCGAADR